MKTAGFNPFQLNAALVHAFDALDSLFYSTMEPSRVVSGKDTELAGFQLSSKVPRPHEFLQSLLDLIRVQYEPDPLGSLFLNGNIAFIPESIRAADTQLGYFSLVSDDAETFENFWRNSLLAHIATLGYSLSGDSRLFLICTTGKHRYGLELMIEVSDVLDAGMSGEEVVALYGACLQGKSREFFSEISRVAGHCQDDVLEQRIRVSGWILS